MRANTVLLVSAVVALFICISPGFARASIVYSVSDGEVSCTQSSTNCGALGGSFTIGSSGSIVSWSLRADSYSTSPPSGPDYALITTSAGTIGFGNPAPGTGYYAASLPECCSSAFSGSTNAGSWSGSNGSYNYSNPYTSLAGGTGAELQIDFNAGVALAAGTYSFVETVGGTAQAPPTIALETSSGVVVATTAPVPLPATVWLMLSGIGGLSALARKRLAA